METEQLETPAPLQDSLVSFWSYSSMSALLNNPFAFKKKYILKVYDDLSSSSAVVGKACHKAMEMYYKGSEVHEAIEAGLLQIHNTPDLGIDYGKTGSREKIIKNYTQAVNFYFAELPVYHEILGVEASLTKEIETITGQKLSLPAKSISDLITRNKLDEIEIIDHKFVGSYTDGDADSFSHFLQSMFNYHTVKAEFGEAPVRMIFNELKISENKDKTPQLQPYVVEFNAPGKMSDFATFYRLFESCTHLVNLPGMVFLPNPKDIFDGQNSFELFRAGTTDIERPTTVRHKTEQVQFVDKQYVASAFDKVENKGLSPEERIRLKLQEFGISVEMRDTYTGASVIKYTMKPSRGVRMSQFDKLAQDIALAIKAHSIRIDAPIRGTDLVGVEVPSLARRRVDLAESHLLKNTMSIPVGIDVYGELVRKDLTDMPHLLVAGATGSGKSVMLNVIISALIRQMSPKGMRLVLVDPKRVELSRFRDAPHLMLPIVYEDSGATEVLNDLVKIMETRYVELEKTGVRSIDEYNKLADPLPKIVVVIDEFADLMLSGGNAKKATKKAGTEEAEVLSCEHLIVRLAQKARAVGIHLVLATQRPSADVVTGLIKANIPTKIAFMTTTAINSRVILDQNGAEELTGKGDMLFLDPSKNGLERLQGLYE